jgi:predicted nucleic acid-binding Zn finger protein
MSRTSLLTPKYCGGCGRELMSEKNKSQVQFDVYTGKPREIEAERQFLRCEYWSFWGENHDKWMLVPISSGGIWVKL